MILSNQILSFLSHLQSPANLPREVVVMNPYEDPIAWGLCQQFYRKYYSDDQPRTLILGINPGRFGGGITGIPFTDPVKLEQDCKISNTLNRRTELSADFIYQMIRAFGGPAKFYSRFYISAVSPLGFTLDGKNLNYYDQPALKRNVTPYIIESLQAHLRLGIRRDICFCLGDGKNFRFLSKLNEQHHFFKKIVPLAHPRFIMQYRRKKVNDYIADYLTKFNLEDGHAM